MCPWETPEVKKCNLLLIVSVAAPGSEMYSHGTPAASYPSGKLK